MLSKILAGLTAVLAFVALYFRSKADRANSRADNRDKVAAEAQRDQVVKSQKALAESQKKGAKDIDKAESDIIPDFFDND